MMDHKTWRLVGKLLLAGLLTWAALTWALPLLAPFLAGLLIAWLAEPAIGFLTRRTGLSRGPGCVAALLGFYLLLGLGLFFVLRRVVYEASALANQLPALLAGLDVPLARLQGTLDRLIAKVPDGLAQALQANLDRLLEGSSAALEQLWRRVLTGAANLALRLPGLLFGLLTAILSSFFISLELPELRGALRRLPDRIAGPLTAVATRIRQALGGWLQAQLKLMGVTFLLVTGGLFLMGLDYALLTGALVALVDALPVFGSGTVLLPWAAVCLLRGDTAMGIEIAVLYAIAALTRQVLEPRLIGRHMGLSPLLTLVSIYVGFRLFGVAGMIGLPMAAMIARQFWQTSGAPAALPEQTPVSDPLRARS